MENKFKKKFIGGETIAIADERLEDGVYAWESRLSPIIDPAIREEMVAVRVSGNFQEEQQLIAELREDGHIPTLEQAAQNVQSGHFTIQDGVIVFTDEFESSNSQ